MGQQLLYSKPFCSNVNITCVGNSPTPPPTHGALYLEEGDEGLCLPNCQSNLVIALYALSLLFCNFIPNHNRLSLGRYEPSSPVSCHAPLCPIL